MTLAHGISTRQDLPIPLGFAVTGAGLAVLASFVVMAVLWKRSRLRGDEAGYPLPAGVARVLDAPATRVVLRLIGLAGAAFFVLTAGYGPPDPLVNPAPGLVYVFFWVGLVPLSLLFGPVWKLLNPLRTLHGLIARLAGLPSERGLAALPRWVGYWPAAVGLLGFTWLELVAPASDQPRVLLICFAGYAVVHLVAATVYGAGWFDRADAFEAYSTLAGRLAPVGRRADGRLALRNPFDGLDGLRLEPGLVAVVAVWLGSTAYDGFSRSTLWGAILTAYQGPTVSATLVRTVGFLLVVGLATGLYVGCTAAATALGTEGRRALPRQFAHSLVPIAIGYTVAHYFSLLVFAGQRTLALASDPLDTGADYLGTAGLQPDYSVPSATTIAVVQVAAVVLGHVLGVVAAHDRAARLFPLRQAVAGQVPLLVLMVGNTVGGLSLLFAA